MENQREKTTETLFKIKPRSSSRRLLLFPVPLQGHINPMLQLANILYSRGFRITVLHTRFNAPNKANYPHFTFQAVLDNDTQEIQAKTSDGVGNLLARVIMLNRYGANQFLDELSQLLSASLKEKDPVAYLITDALWHFTQPVADSLKIPRIVLRTTSLACILVYEALQSHLNLQTDGFVLEFNSEAPLQDFQMLKQKDILMIGNDCNTQPIRELLTDTIKQMKASSGIIWNSFKELEGPEHAKMLQDFPIQNYLIGPFHKYFPASTSSLLEQDRRSMLWLGNQALKSVIYVSFGSLAQLDKTDFLEIAHGLANSNQPFLWVVRPGSIKGFEWIELLPHGFLEELGGRACMVKWAPQQEVLAHPATGAFWTHNGWNSTLESICEGVPMICSPIFGDQPINARYVHDVWKVGLYLDDGFRREEIENAIKRVLIEKDGEDMREKTMRLKNKVNTCLEKGGSSYASLESLVNHMSS